MCEQSIGNDSIDYIQEYSAIDTTQHNFFPTYIVENNVNVSVKAQKPRNQLNELSERKTNKKNAMER